MGELAALAVQERDVQDARPVHERLFIGGSLMAIVLTRDNISLFKVMDFDDKQADWLEMNENLNREHSDVDMRALVGLLRRRT